LVHALPNVYSGHQISAVDEWIGQVTHFAVPGFLACSGYLFAGSPGSRSWGSVRPRLERILLPYLVFSAAAWCYCNIWAAFGHQEDPTPFSWKLLLFSTMGHYYYVFLIAFLVLVTPLVARIPHKQLWLVAILAMSVQLAIELQLIPLAPLFWHVRNPLRCLGPFLLGWWAWLARERLLEQASGWRRLGWSVLLLSLTVGSWAGLGLLDLFSQLRLLVGWVGIYTSLGLMLMATLGRDRMPQTVCWLGSASYPLYLSHVFFMTPLLFGWPYVPGTFDLVRILAAWATGLVGSIALVMLCRQVLGAKSARKWIG